MELISIHAPVKGATMPDQITVLPYRDFNPRTREGCDRRFVVVGDEVVHISIHAPVKGAT